MICRTLNLIIETLTMLKLVLFWFIARFMHVGTFSTYFVGMGNRAVHCYQFRKPHCTNSSFSIFCFSFLQFFWGIMLTVKKYISVTKPFFFLGFSWNHKKKKSQLDPFFLCLSWMVLEKKSWNHEKCANPICVLLVALELHLRFVKCCLA